MPSASLIKEFEQLVGKENVFSSEADRQSYAYDAAVLKPMIPSLVVRPTEVEQLGQVVKRCYEEGIPMTVRGSGTNLTGGTIPDCSDTIVILTTGLNKILEINTEDLYATVQPGVITAKFAAAVAAKGLFYPPDPGSMSVSTIGGNVAESSGGLRGLKYGTTKDYVMGMEVFANTGDLVKTGSRTVKCATGYNIAPLLVGSEGTLAVTSKVTLKLIPPPKASKAMMALFKDMDGASQAVAGIIAAHVVPCTLEFMDNATINYVEDYVNIGLPRDAAAILLIEVDGHPAQVADEAVSVEKVLKDSGALEVVVAKDAAEKTRIWEARRVAIPALARCRPTLMLEDATVPRSKIPAMLEALDKIAARHHVTIGTFGHAGDGTRPSSATSATRKNSPEWSGPLTICSMWRWSLVARCRANTASALPKRNGLNWKPPREPSSICGVCAPLSIRRSCSTLRRSFPSRVFRDGGRRLCGRQVLTFYSGRNGPWMSLPNLPMP